MLYVEEVTGCKGLAEGQTVKTATSPEGRQFCVLYTFTNILNVSFPDRNLAQLLACEILWMYRFGFRPCLLLVGKV